MIFFALQASGVHTHVAEALKRSGAQCAVEETARAMAPTERMLHRQTNSQLLLEELHDWMNHLRLPTADGSDPARAIDYTLNCCAGLVSLRTSANHRLATIQ